jgi:hypothetical protein
VEVRTAGTVVRPTTARGPEIVLAALAGATSLAACVGAVQLFTGSYAPPVEDLRPLGLASWRLPAVWLLATVAVPCGTAAVLALRRSPRAGSAGTVAAGLLALELATQVPFVGPDPLQAVMGAVAVALAGVGVAARRAAHRRSAAGGAHGRTV